MLLKEVMQKSGLTRKQIEIVQQKGFIHPARGENGYRNYTDQDLKILRQISFLKNFEFSLDECYALLIKGDTTVLDQKKEQYLSKRYRLETSLQYLDQLKDPETQTVELESVE